jgi:hypothetical protein
MKPPAAGLLQEQQYLAESLTAAGPAPVAAAGLGAGPDPDSAICFPSTAAASTGFGFGTKYRTALTGTAPLVDLDKSIV